MCKKFCFALAAALFVAGAATPARAATIAATEIGSGLIVMANTTTNTVTTIGNVGGFPDSLIFDPAGRIIYTDLSANTVVAFNPITNTKTPLASGFSGPQDIALEPSGTSILVSDTAHDTAGAGVIYRVPLTGGSKVPLKTGLNGPRGITYDNAGNLFLVTSGDGLVRKIDPVTGNTLTSITISPNNGIDGITFDPVTGALWVADGASLAKLPTSLASFSILTPTNDGISFIDGLESDGAGNIFLADSVGQRIVQYIISSNMSGTSTTVPNLDDVAPIVGLGAGGGAVPEPSTVLLLGAGLVGLAGYGRRRGKQA